MDHVVAMGEGKPHWMSHDCQSLRLSFNQVPHLPIFHRSYCTIISNPVKCENAPLTDQISVEISLSVSLGNELGLFNRDLYLMMGSNRGPSVRSSLGSVICSLLVIDESEENYSLSLSKSHTVELDPERSLNFLLQENGKVRFLFYFFTVYFLNLPMVRPLLLGRYYILC
jgi:hypothetical protein